MASLPTKRSGAGIILRDSKGRILLVKPSYKNHWSLPGGTVDANESPVMTCIREAKEELDIAVVVIRLLAVRYEKNATWGGESYEFIFDGGVLPENSKISVDGDEILEVKFVPLDEVKNFVDSGRAKRLKIYEEALRKGRTVFVDNGKILE